MTTRPRQRDAHSVMIEQWLDEVLADPAFADFKARAFHHDDRARGGRA
jgi:hypothetical protein